MTVTFNSNYQKFLKHVGVGEEYLAAVTTLKGKLTFVSKNFKIGSNKYWFSGTMPFNQTQLMKMPETSDSCAAAKMAIEATIYKFTQMADPSCLKVQLTAPAGDNPSVGAAVQTSFNKIKPEAAKVVVETPVKVEPTSIGSVVKLADAGLMYQPVRGTSGGSVYSVVAIANKIRVAVKTTSEKLSVRVEGPGIETPAIAKKLVEMGFSETKGSHFSLHMACGTVPIDRVVGAVLAGIGLEFSTPMPVLARVKEVCK